MSYFLLAFSHKALLKYRVPLLIFCASVCLFLSLSLLSSCLSSVFFKTLQGSRFFSLHTPPETTRSPLGCVQIPCNETDMLIKVCVDGHEESWISSNVEFYCPSKETRACGCVEVDTVDAVSAEKKKFM